MLYALLSDIFAPNCKVFLKAHPGDKTDYTQIFKNQVIVEKGIPSELLRFIIDKKFDIGICTFSTSIRSLTSYINNIYNIDDTIVEFKDKIFKYLVLFELAKTIGFNIKHPNDSLINCFSQKYSLKGNDYINFNCSNTSNKEIFIKENKFDAANLMIEIKEKIDTFNQKTKFVEKLYIEVEDLKLIEKIKKFNYNVTLPISNVCIEATIKQL